MSARLQKTAKPEPAEKPGPHRGVLDLAHAEQNFSLRRYYPSATLAPFIEHFWIIHWDLRGRPDYTAEVLPHPAVNLAFTRERGWITGVTTAKYTYHLEGAGDVVLQVPAQGAFRAPQQDRDREQQHQQRPGHEPGGEVHRARAPRSLPLNR